jgi:hypothetical protein
VAKDRARPFSRKHRKYWFTVTGGMILIGVLNVGLGLCSYAPPPPAPQVIRPELPPPSAPVLEPGGIPLAEVPAEVMRAFAEAHPRTLPRGAKKVAGPDGTTRYEIAFGPDGQLTRVVFHADGAPASP